MQNVFYINQAPLKITNTTFNGNNLIQVVISR